MHIEKTLDLSINISLAHRNPDVQKVFQINAFQSLTIFIINTQSFVLKNSDFERFSTPSYSTKNIYHDLF